MTYKGTQLLSNVKAVTDEMVPYLPLKLPVNTVVCNNCHGKAKTLMNAAFLEVEARYCEICTSGASDDEMLLCDACDDGCHTFCLSPPLEAIPRGEWYCLKCVNVGAFAAEGAAAGNSAGRHERPRGVWRYMVQRSDNIACRLCQTLAASTGTDEAATLGRWPASGSARDMAAAVAKIELHLEAAHVTPFVAAAAERTRLMKEKRVSLLAAEAVKRAGDIERGRIKDKEEKERKMEGERALNVMRKYVLPRQGKWVCSLCLDLGTGIFVINDSSLSTTTTAAATTTAVNKDPPNRETLVLFHEHILKWHAVALTAPPLLGQESHFRVEGDQEESSGGCFESAAVTCLLCEQAGNDGRVRMQLQGTALTREERQNAVDVLMRSHLRRAHASLVDGGGGSGGGGSSIATANATTTSSSSSSSSSSSNGNGNGSSSGNGNGNGTASSHSPLPSLIPLVALPRTGVIFDNEIVSAMVKVLGKECTTGWQAAHWASAVFRTAAGWDDDEYTAAPVCLQEAYEERCTSLLPKAKMLFYEMNHQQHVCVYVESQFLLVPVLAQDLVRLPSGACIKLASVPHKSPPMVLPPTCSREAAIVICLELHSRLTTEVGLSIPREACARLFFDLGGPQTKPRPVKRGPIAASTQPSKKAKASVVDLTL